MAKKFKFQLDALKRYRENRLLVARKELLRVEASIFEASSNLRRAFAERADLVGGSAPASLRTLYAGLAESETARIRKIESEIKQLEEERERHARWVTHLGKELKAIEKLEEKRREAHDAELRLSEKKFMDSWVAERWFHRGSLPGASTEEGIVA